MLKTIVVLVSALVILPLIVFRFDQPLSIEQWEMIKTSGLIMLAVAVVCFITGELTHNTSQVDKIWSLAPVVYAWVFALMEGYSPRLLLMAILVTVWGARLTYNFWRKGGYSWRLWAGEEDYRWAVVRENPLLKGRIRWMLFDLFFVSLYQNTLLLLITLPMVAACQNSGNDITLGDMIIAGLFVALVIIEGIADQQQWNFQGEKKRLMVSSVKPEGEYAQGFISSGLFARVRHPNYAAEQAIWICFYFFSVLVTGRWINWSAAGSLLLIVLFQSSSDFSEKISMQKYTGYAEFKKKVPRFIPRFW